MKNEREIIHELNKLYYMSHLVNNSHNRLTSLLGNRFIQDLKRSVNMSIQWTNKVLNIADSFYCNKVDEFEDNQEILEEIIDLCMNLNTEEKKLKAVATLKLIANVN